MAGRGPGISMTYGHWPAGGKAQATPNRMIWSTKQNSLNEEVR